MAKDAQMETKSIFFSAAVNSGSIYKSRLMTGTREGTHKMNSNDEPRYCSQCSDNDGPLFDLHFHEKDTYQGSHHP